MAKKNHKDAALQYVKENNGWSEAQLERAYEIMEEWRCPISQADEGIEWNIREMLDDYGNDNDLEEGWWYEYWDDPDEFFDDYSMLD